MNRLFLIFVISTLLIPVVSAQIGSFTIVESNSYTGYNFGGTGGGYTPNVSAFLFANTNYDTVNFIKISTAINTAPKEFDSTPFRIVNGGTGNGTAYYIKSGSSNQIGYIFQYSNLTGPRVDMVFDVNIFSTLTYNTFTPTEATVTASKPICLTSTGAYMNYCTSYRDHDVSVGVTSSVNYNATYFTSALQEQYFIVNISNKTKSQSVVIEDINHVKYFGDTTSSLTGFSSTAKQGDGIYANITLSGPHHYFTINSTSISVDEGGSVDFSKKIYPPNEDINISYSVTNPDFNTKSYYMKFFNPSNQQLLTFQITNASGTWKPTFNKNVMGNYSVWLGYQMLGCGYFCADFFIDKDYTNYGNQPTSISGNITTNKNTYNVSETMVIYYNTTTAGQISIKNMNGFVSARNLNSYVGTNKVTTYVFQPDTGTGGDPLGNYILTLEYKNYLGNWITLGSKSVNLISPTAIIEFLLTSYYQGDSAEFYFYAKEAGNVTVYDPAGNVKYFRTVSAGDINTRIDDNFYIKSADPTGTWTAKLYNSTGIADQATVIVKKKGPGITPTITGTLPPTPTGTVDYLGNATNKKQKENEILNTLYSTITGLLMLSILATMIFFLKKMKW